VGVSGKGEPTGITVTDQLLQNLASIRGDGNILPFPSLVVQKRVLKGHDVAVVMVHPSSAPPVRFKGTIWIRTGPRRGIASPDDERRLNEKFGFGIATARRELEKNGNPDLEFQVEDSYVAAILRR